MAARQETALFLCSGIYGGAIAMSAPLSGACPAIEGAREAAGCGKTASHSGGRVAPAIHQIEKVRYKHATGHFNGLDQGRLRKVDAAFYI